MLARQAGREVVPGSRVFKNKKNIPTFTKLDFKARGKLF